MKKSIIIIITMIITIIVCIIGFELKVYFDEKACKSRIFDDMQSISDNYLRGIIGIIGEDESGKLKGHSGIGSGVIFDKKGNTYYALSARHVIENEYSKIKIFTKDTEFNGEVIHVDDGVDFEIPDEEYYKSLLDGKVEYISSSNDLAIISFEYDGDLKVLEFDDNEIKVDDKIMVIGHPDGNRYKITYGYIKSKMVNAGVGGKNEKVLKHNAYMKKGNSGGVALSKNMKIVGINIGGSFSLFQHYRNGFMIPNSIVIENINKWNNEK